MKFNFEKLKSWVWLVVFIAIIVLITFYSSQFFIKLENLRELVARAGIFGPLIFLFIQFIQVVVAPISHYAIQAAGGAIFGFWLGGALNYVGSVLGSLFAFFLARRYGIPLVRKIVPEKIMSRYSSVVQKIGPFGLFLIYFLPLFPDDELIYLIGLSKMKFRDFLGATLFGRIGGMFGMAFVGATIAKPTKIGVIVILVLCVFGAVVFSFRKRLEKWFNARFVRKGA